MIAICRFNKGSDIGKSPDGFFYSDHTVFHVTAGDQYEIAGLGIFNGVLLLLTMSDAGLPSWLPVALFDLDRSQRLPANWEFAAPKPSGDDPFHAGWSAIWGYSELVRDGRHRDRLIQYEEDALMVFARQGSKH